MVDTVCVVMIQKFFDFFVDFLVNFLRVLVDPLPNFFIFKVDCFCFKVWLFDVNYFELIGGL